MTKAGLSWLHKSSSRHAWTTLGSKSKREQACPGLQARMSMSRLMRACLDSVSPHMSMSRLGRGPLSSCMCKYMHNYYTAFAVVAGIFVHCALISSDRSSSHYHLSHRINLFAETHMLCNVHAVVFTGNCVLSIHTYVCNVYTHTHSYTWCRVEGVCMRAPPGHRPSVYERIRLGRPPSLPSPMPGA